MELVQDVVTVSAKKSGLAELRTYLRRLCTKAGVSPKTSRRVILAVDEALSNVMEHSTLSAESFIEISVKISGRDVVAQICDEGEEFDPSTRIEGLPENKQGMKRGFGLYVIHLVADSVKYKRADGTQNILTLTFVGS